MYYLWDIDENRWADNGAGKALSETEALAWLKERNESQAAVNSEWYAKNYPNGCFTLFKRISGEQPAVF